MSTPVRDIIDALHAGLAVDDCDLLTLLHCNQTEEEYLFSKARDVAQRVYGNAVYSRGLIELSSYCQMDCYYCGIRKSNRQAERYRLTHAEILDCCATGYPLGFRTFVLQGGEDPWFTDDRLCAIIHDIATSFPDCAITLSLGERSRDSYQRLFDAGAHRYLLRHETSNAAHYGLLHPPTQELSTRINCLYQLRNIGYQVGCGFMVGTPHQSMEHLLGELRFLQEFQPHMVGIGPFLPHHQTPFANEPAGSLTLTLRLLAIIRLLLPQVLLPATTALGTINPKGRESGILSGANVVMPNLSPTSVRKKYALYDNKICTGDEAAECRSCLTRRMDSIGYALTVARGDSPRISLAENQLTEKKEGFAP